MYISFHSLWILVSDGISFLLLFLLFVIYPLETPSILLSHTLHFSMSILQHLIYIIFIYKSVFYNFSATSFLLFASELYIFIFKTPFIILPFCVYLLNILLYLIFPFVCFLCFMLGFWFVGTMLCYHLFGMSVFCVFLLHLLLGWWDQISFYFLLFITIRPML